MSPVGFVWILLVVLVVVIEGTIPTPRGAPPTTPVVTPRPTPRATPRPSPSPTPLATTAAPPPPPPPDNLLHYNNGPLLNNDVPFRVVFKGADWLNRSLEGSFQSSKKFSMVLDLFEGLSGSDFFRPVEDELMFGNRVQLRVAQVFFDALPGPYSTDLDALGTELCSKFANNNPSMPTALLMDQLPAGYCGAHTRSTCGAPLLGVWRVDGYGIACGVDGGGVELISVLSHEIAETVSDPSIGQGWLDASGEEVADKCIDLNSNYTLSNGAVFRLQKLWSNKANACV